MNNLCLVPFIGLPASGKSTTAIELVKCCSNISFIYISYDWFQHKFNLIVIDYKSGKYKEFREFMLKLIHGIVAALRSEDHEFVDVGKLLAEYEVEWNLNLQCIDIRGSNNICILIDDNHFYRSMRYEIYQIAKRYGTGFLQIYFKSTLQNSIMRNAKRCLIDQVPEKIIISMNARLEPPNVKNSWEKFHCVINIDENEISLPNIYHCLFQQTTNPEKPYPSHEITKNIQSSKLHEIDLYLRKLISECLSRNPRIQNPKELNDKRKQILADLRAHIIEIPTNLDEIQEYFIFNK